MKKVVENDNNVVKTLSSMDRPLSLIKSYNEYVKSFKEKNKDTYRYFEQKFLQNDKIAEEIIKDLNNVSSLNSPLSASIKSHFSIISNTSFVMITKINTIIIFNGLPTFSRT